MNVDLDCAWVNSADVGEKPRKAVRLPVKQSLFDANREPVLYGISLILASSPVTIVRSIAVKVSGLHTHV